MRYTISLLLLLVGVILAGCSGRERPAVLIADNLPSDVYNIRTDRDTVLHTKNGAMIHIPRGALVSATGSAKLAVSEAYTIKDIMMAGLVTKSGHKPLSSGGMINISVSGSEKVSIVKPLQVSIPTKERRPGMQLYKGEVQSNGNIDWKDPAPLGPPNSANSEVLNSGRILFNANCASCHNPIKEATGPPLAFLDKRRDKEWLYRFIHDCTRVIAGDDLVATNYGNHDTTDMLEYLDHGYAMCIYNYYNKTQMTSFPNLTRNEVNAIFEYVDNIAKDIDAATIRDYKAAFDSCKLYRAIVVKLAMEREKLTEENGPQVNKEVLQRPADAPDENGGAPKPPNLVAFAEGRAAKKPAEYYQFSIKTFGWYNVDKLIDGLPGFEESELMVKTTGIYQGNICLYMALPKQKILLDGGLIDGKNDIYGFYTNDGKISLPQAAQAVVFAVGADKGQLYFGDLTFTTTRKLSMELKMRPVVRQEIDSIINDYNFDGVNFATELTRNATRLREVDSVLGVAKGLKPANWDCDCGTGEPTYEK